jgi:predicted Ser/Thr protein kinase
VEDGARSSVYSAEARGYPRRNRWKARIEISSGTVLDWEEAALRRLEGVRGVPRFVARPHALALRMAEVPGVPLQHLRRSGGTFSRACFEDLRRLVAEIHDRGVAHGDAHMKNVLVHGDAAYLIDFATAYVRGRFPVLDGFLFRRYRMLDGNRLFRIEQKFFGTGTAPRMFFLYRAAKALGRHRKRRYRDEA